MAMNETERNQLKEALHKINNALNSISMQAELAKLYVDQDEREKIPEALEIIMSQCRHCSSITRNTHSLINDRG